MKSENIELSIVIPAWNEEERLGPTLEGLAHVLEARRRPFEFVVVDDGSTDGTVALCERVAQRIRQLRIVCGGENRGKGHAVRLGMLAARGRLRVMCDADGAMRAAELPKLLDAVAGGADVVIGSRYAGGAAPHAQPLWRRAWSRMTNALIRRTLVPGILDMHSGYKAFTAEAAEAVFSRATVDGWAFDLEILAFARRLDLRILEVPIAWADDPRSRVRPLHDLGRVVRETLAIRRNLERSACEIAPRAM